MQPDEGAERRIRVRKYWQYCLLVLACINFALIGVLELAQQRGAPDQRRNMRTAWTPLRFEPRSKIRLANVVANREAHFRFDVFNAASEPVRITRIWTTCGCTDVRLQQTRIPPAKAVPLTGTVSARRTAGEYSVRITLSFSGESSGRTGIVECDVSGSVIAKVAVAPNALDLRPDSYRRKAGQSAITVRNVSAEDVMIVANTEGAGSLSISPGSRLIAPEASVELTIVAPADAQASQEIITIALSGNESQEVHRIPVRIRPYREIEVRPPLLLLGKLEWSGLQLKSGHPPHLQLTGPLLDGAQVEVRSAPNPLKNPQIVRSGQGTVEVRFELSSSWDGEVPQEPLRIAVFPVDGSPQRTLDVPVYAYGSIGSSKPLQSSVQPAASAHQ